MTHSLHGFQWGRRSCRDNGHGGDVTEGEPSIIGTSTDVDDMRAITGATQGESDMET